VEEVEEAEEAEEIEEAEEAEELEEAEEAEEIEAAEAVEEGEKIGAAEAVEEAETEAAEQPLFVEAEEQETLEELEGVKQIVPLPPLPEEQLEELPTADEAEGAPSPAPASQLPEETVAAAEGPSAFREEAVEELEVAEDEAAPIESILSAGEELVMEPIPGQENMKQLSLEEIDKLQKADEREQLQALLDAGVIRAYSLKEIEAIIMEQRSSVVMENGVYRIKEEIIAGAEGKGRRGLMALAEASLEERGKSNAGLESGIGALLGDESIVDLETEIGQIQQTSAEIGYTSPTKSRKIQFFEDGLDYDGYLKSFRGGKTETDRLRSLVELSGKLKAVNAAVFGKSDGKYSLELKVGLNDPGFEVSFAPDEPFVQMFIASRQTVILGENIEKIKALSKKIHPEDLKYMQSAIILPVVYDNRESFLLLGLPVLRDLDIEDAITRLEIH
jgi:hypothetical protein